MQIARERCIGCGRCIPYCSMNAISLREGKASIDLNACVECGICRRGARCPVDAIYQQELDELRSICSYISDPRAKRPEKYQGSRGRGTEEIKTNDVTGRVQPGEFNVTVEMGRPCCGVTMEDVEKVTRAIAPIGVQWEEISPFTAWIADRNTGALNPKIRELKVLTCLLEFLIPQKKLAPVLRALKGVEPELSCTFMLSLMAPFEKDGSIPALDTIAALGVTPLPNPKINLGMGRPLALERKI